MKPEMKWYKIAFVNESGEWDIVEEFEAESDDAANKYAEYGYTGNWFVLDDNNTNINAW